MSAPADAVAAALAPYADPTLADRLLDVPSAVADRVLDLLSADLSGSSQQRCPRRLADRGA